MTTQILVLIILCFTSLSFAQKKLKPVPALPAKSTLEAPYSQHSLTRVDPHGSKDIKPTIEQVKQSNDCKVCHFFQGNELKTKTTALETCFNCHNRSPHSGVQEHLKHKITCIDCHTLHRGSAIKWVSASGTFKDLPTQKIESGLVEKTAHSAMLKKSCTQCHKN